jgi:hypothetical protein
MVVHDEIVGLNYRTSKAGTSGILRPELAGTSGLEPKASQA